MVILAEIMGEVFQVDLRSPTRPAKSWIGGRWADHDLTNEDVLYGPDCHLVGESTAEAAVVFGPLVRYR